MDINEIVKHRQEKDAIEKYNATLFYQCYLSVVTHIKAYKVNGEGYNVFKHGLRKYNVDKFLKDRDLFNRWDYLTKSFILSVNNKGLKNITQSDMLIAIASTFKANNNNWFPKGNLSSSPANTYIAFNNDKELHFVHFEEDMNKLVALAKLKNTSLLNILYEYKHDETPLLIWLHMGGEIHESTVYILNRLCSTIHPLKYTLFYSMHSKFNHVIVRMIISRQYLWEDLYTIDYTMMLAKLMEKQRCSLV
jgi:hypothetical protein